MYEYPDLDNINAMVKELHEAIKHDAVLHGCYSYFKTIYGDPDPFVGKEFFIYTAYMALSMNQRHLKVLRTNAERSIDPPIVLQLGDDVYAKEEVDKLIKDNNRSYWQKLWNAVLGR